MTSFCRHRRLESTCPICSRKREQQSQGSSRPRRTTRSSGGAPVPGTVRRSGASRRRAPAGGVSVRRLARAADDGYESPLVPGLRATVDAERLAEELAFAAARLAELEGGAAPGLYGEAAALGRQGSAEEGLWLAFQIACIGPLPDPHDAFAQIAQARVPWAAGELPALTEVTFGPRGLGDGAVAERTLAAYRSWAERGGGQAAALAGETSWTPERRLDRAFERLALPGLGRAQRYEFLLSAGALGLAEMRAASLHLLGDPRDATVLAAKRVFGIGDLLLVARRAGELASACALAPAALDLGLVNWGRRTDHPDAERISCGSTAQPDADVHALIRAALELPPDDA